MYVNTIEIIEGSCDVCECGLLLCFHWVEGRAFSYRCRKCKKKYTSEEVELSQPAYFYTCDKCGVEGVIMPDITEDKDGVLYISDPDFIVCEQCNTKYKMRGSRGREVRGKSSTK